MRRAILKVSPVFLGEFFRNGEVHIKIESGLPDDAKFIGVQYDHKKDCFDLCYESTEFAEIKEDEPMPVLPPPLAKRIKCQ